MLYTGVVHRSIECPHVCAVHEVQICMLHSNERLDGGQIMDLEFGGEVR
jgi:hypothetical protein